MWRLCGHSHSTFRGFMTYGWQGPDFSSSAPADLLFLGNCFSRCLSNEEAFTIERTAMNRQRFRPSPGCRARHSCFVGNRVTRMSLKQIILYEDALVTSRDHDLQDLQFKLANRGLSALERLEGSVLASLQYVMGYVGAMPELEVPDMRIVLSRIMSLQPANMNVPPSNEC